MIIQNDKNNWQITICAQTMVSSKYEFNNVFIYEFIFIHCQIQGRTNLEKQKLPQNTIKNNKIPQKIPQNFLVVYHQILCGILWCFVVPQQKQKWRVVQYNTTTRCGVVLITGMVRTMEIYKAHAKPCAQSHAQAHAHGQTHAYAVEPCRTLSGRVRQGSQTVLRTLPNTIRQTLFRVWYFGVLV